MNAKPQPSTGLVRRMLYGIAGAIAAALLATAAWYGYEAVLAQPIQRVVFAGDVDKLPRLELEALSNALRGAQPGSVTVSAVREAAKRVTWVRDASVRRQFPDAVEIHFQAHDAFAAWNEGAVVSTRGEVFAAPAPAELPRFRGPDGTAATMMHQYSDFASALKPLGAAISELRLSARGAWLVILDSGLTLQLGRGDVTPRLERFVAAWPIVSNRLSQPGQVDLRYPNGFAIKRAAVLTVEPQKK